MLQRHERYITMNLFGWFGSDADDAISSGPDINPMTGLPMCGGVDTAGNPYGTDLHNYDDMSTTWDSGSIGSDSGSCFDSDTSGFDTFSIIDTGSSFDTGISSSSTDSSLSDW